MKIINLFQMVIVMKNLPEIEYGTSCASQDSDKDGLTDGEEVYTYDTDPTEADTDGDGLNDGDEILLGFNPNKKYSNDDSVLDGKIEVTYNVSTDDNKIKVQIRGKASEVVTSIDLYDDEFMQQNLAFLSDIVDINSTGDFDTATVEFRYEGEAEEIGLFLLDEEKNEWVEVEGVTIDKDDKILTANLEHFSIYAVADKSKINRKTDEIHVSFVLDHSGSMEDNDPSYIRKKVVRDLINTLEASDKTCTYSTVMFTGKATVLQGQTKDKNKVIASLDKMNDENLGADGTFIGEGLFRGVDELEGKDGMKFVILLSDGDDSAYLNPSWYQNTVLNNAKDAAIRNNIQVITVGLGSGVNVNKLKSLSSATGGRYYSAANSEALIALFAGLAEEMSDVVDKIDLDKNGEKETEAIVVADSGFRAEKNGVAYSNFSSTVSTGGQCFGFSALTSGYYNKNIPSTNELIVVEKDIGGEIELEYDLTKLGNEKNIINIKSETLAQLDKLYNASVLFSEDKNNPSAVKMYESEIKNGRRNLTDEAKEILKEIAVIIYDVPVLDDNGDVEYVYEEYYLDIESEKMSKLSQAEQQLLKTIVYYANTQKVNPIGQVLASENKFFKKIDMDFEQLESLLKSQGATMISFRGSAGGHATVAQRILQDAKNDNIYYIEMYDNNYPKAVSYIKVEKTKKIFGGYSYSYSLLTDYTNERLGKAFGIALMKFD